MASVPRVASDLQHRAAGSEERQAQEERERANPSSSGYPLHETRIGRSQQRVELRKVTMTPGEPIGAGVSLARFLEGQPSQALVPELVVATELELGPPLAHVVQGAAE